MCTKIWKLFCFFRSLNMLIVIKMKNYEKSVDFVTSRISLCGHINFSTTE